MAEQIRVRLDETRGPSRVRREALRWLILLTLNNARPIGAFEGPILAVAQSEYPDASTVATTSSGRMLRAFAVFS